MVETISDDNRYQIRFTNGTDAAVSDATNDKGGTGSGFPPHELLEAAKRCPVRQTLSKRVWFPAR
jgi:uncharacterized OsmC-like protein